ncbi:MAG: flagellar hook-associated protein 3 FlgL [Ascidiaceihabitans sp.]|jgi:flagellar hook-associated protein 3 FlgL
MNSLSIGDLANSFLLQRRGTALKVEMSRLTQELATGQVSDIKTVLAGNFSYLSDIENSMRTLAGYKVASAEAAQMTGTMQAVLENVQNVSSDFAADLIAVSTGGLDSIAKQSATEAHQHLDSVVSALNTNFAGRNLFSGTATNTVPMPSSDTILSALRAELSGIIGADSKAAAAKAWFDDPAGFDSVIYQGSADDLAPFRLSDTEDLSLNVRANSGELKDIIRNLAMAGLANDASLAIGAAERKDILLASGEGLISAQDNLTSLRANIGFAEERIDQIATRNASEMTAMEYAKGSLLAADPYETVTRLEEVQFQLQSLYTITSRSSELTLVNFLR